MHDRSFSEVHLDIEPGRRTQRPDAAPREDAVFRLAICGDFSARGGPGSAGAARPASSTRRVDRDDVDDVLAAVAPSLRLELSGELTFDVRITAFDDFHPDRLFEQVPQFARLRELRTRLMDPSTFGNAAAALSAAPTPRPTPVGLVQGSVLDAIMGDASPPDAHTDGARPATDDLYAFLQRAMEPYLVARPDPRQADLVAQVDGALAAAMRALLHHPEFQALESLWRGLFRLVRDVDTSGNLQIHLVDLTRDELATELRTGTSSRALPLLDELEATAPRAEGGWSVLVAHFAFTGSEDAVDLLSRLAQLGADLDAACLTEALPDLAMGDVSEAVADAWQRLRRSPASHFLGLALPRVLLRLPYGADSDEIERFAFEELEATSPHGSYLWGNPALFCAGLLAQQFIARNAEEPARATARTTTLSGLPLHLQRQGGETIAKPCAEVVMTESDALSLLERGFMPMCAVRDQDVVRVPRLQSIADPPARLAGA